MDGDVFAKAGKWGRLAADALQQMIEGRTDPAQAVARCLEKFIGGVGGFRLFAEIVAACRQAWTAPLFAAEEIRRIVSEARVKACEAGRSVIDLITAREAAHAARRGVIHAEDLAYRILQRVSDRLIIESKGGYVAQYGHAHLEQVRTALAPTLHRAAAEFARRPDLQQLGITRGSKVHADTNLLVGDAHE